MKVVPSEIEGYYDITVRFRIEDVQKYVAHDGSQGSPERQRTENFGPGWYFEWYTVTENDKASLGFYFHTGPRGYPEPITWAVVAKSLDDNKKHFEYAMMAHTFTAESNGLGWRSFTSKSYWDGCSILRQENTLCVTATIRARMVPTPCFDKCLNVSHEVVTVGERPCNVSFVTQSIQNGLGQALKRRKLFADREVIGRTCPLLLGCRFSSNRASHR